MDQTILDQRFQFFPLSSLRVHPDKQGGTHEAQMLGFKAVGDVIFAAFFFNEFQHGMIYRMFQGHGLMNGRNSTLTTWKVRGPKFCWWTGRR